MATEPRVTPDNHRCTQNWPGEPAFEREAEQDPDGQIQSRRRRQAQVRAARERQQRIERALGELEQIRAAKHTAEERAQARASLSDPEARIMKQAQGATWGSAV